MFDTSTTGPLGEFIYIADCISAKDARLVTEAAEMHGLDLPVLAAIRERLEEGAPDHGDEDMAATYLTSAPA